jgi:hypothetical protein
MSKRTVVKLGLCALLATAVAVPVARACFAEQAGIDPTEANIEATLSTLTGSLGAGLGYSSPNVQYLGSIPTEGASDTGGRLVGHYFYITSWRDISIYDVADPVHPVLMSKIEIPFRFENEDVDTNGKILLYSDFATTQTLYVYDVRDKRHPYELAELPNAGTHTASCLFDCKYEYGSYHLVGPGGAPLRGGQIVDLRDPSRPKAVGDWTATTLPSRNVHDVNEVKPGFVIAASDPIEYVDARDPLHPKVLAKGTNQGERMHTAIWPNGGADRFLMTMFETNATPTCDLGSGEFSTWDASQWQSTHTFTRIDSFYLSNGNFVDGSPPANTLGCSPHWFNVQPGFRNGGIVALGAYDNGTRFLNVSPAGKISEVGWFLPQGTQASQTFWITKNVVYVVDYARGVDIVRFNGS